MLRRMQTPPFGHWPAGTPPCGFCGPGATRLQPRQPAPRWASALGPCWWSQVNVPAYGLLPTRGPFLARLCLVFSVLKILHVKTTGKKKIPLKSTGSKQIFPPVRQQQTGTQVQPMAPDLKWKVTDLLLKLDVKRDRQMRCYVITVGLDL